MDESELLLQVQSRYRRAKDHTEEWRRECKTSFDYVAGRQWEEEDEALMEEEMRPTATFNRTEVFVQMVTGLEALNRNEVRYIPRKAGQDNGVSDMWTAAAEYVNDDSDAEVAHSEAFRSTVICGMGATETKLSLDTNPEGDIEVLDLDVRYLYWDERARQRNIKDARWIMYVSPMSPEEIESQWPGVNVDYSRMFDPDWENPEPHNADDAWRYENQSVRRTPDGTYWVAQYQWYETEMFYRVSFQEGTKDVPARDWKTAIERAPVLAKLDHAGPFPKRSYKRAFVCGNTVLEVQDMPTEQFTINVITGKHDRTRNIWYGLVRPLMGPQEWVNKLFSQILFIISSNAKGGLMAEVDAFDSVNKAEEEWSRPDRITWLRSGAIAQGKIMPKPQVQYPQGIDRLLMFAMNMFQDVTGANLELLGLADKVQPGVLEAQRKQAGVTILSWAFDSLRSYRKIHGRVLATYIREYIADGRLIRIAGDMGEQYIPLMRDKLALEYDVIVEESPSSANERERTFAVLMQLLPSMIEMGFQIPPSLLDYLPLPTALVEEIKQGMNDPQQKQQEQVADQLEMQDMQAEVAQKQARAQRDQAEALRARNKAMMGE